MRMDFNKSWRFWTEEREDSQLVTIPHDAMIMEKRRPDAPGGSAAAFYPGGRYFYEKEFEVPGEWLEKHVTFVFEGAYKNAKVWLNGHEAGGAAYGYLPFSVCGDGLLCEDRNVMRVETDNRQQPDSRWYTGAGLYRPVWLYVQEKCHIELQGIKISTLSVSPATIRVQTQHTGGAICVEIMDGTETVAAGEGDCAEIEIPEAKLWSDETPYLYTARITLKDDGKTVETVEEKFGVREISWSPKGLFVNGKETLLRGGCIHHDNGILGACAYGKSEERRVRILKNNGFNAVRCAHNPCSRALLEACDKYGIYVMDELWDMWYKPKNKYDYASQFPQHYKQDIRTMVEKDFNHPSVILYSIGNEVSEPAQEKGVALAREMTDYIHSLDDTRAVTGGFNLMIITNEAKGQGIYQEGGGLGDRDNGEKREMNSTMFNMITSMVGSNMNQSANSEEADAVTSPVLDTVDIAGYNYASGRYVMEGEKHPGRLIIGSETFPQDIAKNWKMVEELPYLIGDFMWTAWDYLGEAGIGAWAYTKDAMGFEKPYPWLLADTGAFDIAGNPNGEAMLARAAWHQSAEPLIGVRPVNHRDEDLIKAAWRGTNALPTWSWKGCQGTMATVEVYSDSSEVELFLNGASMGRKAPEQCMASYQIPYQPGRLEAAAYDNAGKETGRSSLTSASGQVSVCILPEESSITEGEIAYFDIELRGENGEWEANADTYLTAEVENGVLLAFGSANPRTEEQYQEGAFTTYYGRAQAVVRAERAGLLEMTIKGKGLGEASVQVNVVPAFDRRSFV